jgi:parallel beta-helix repeat protein
MTSIASRLSRYFAALLFSSLFASAASATVTFQTVTNTNDTGSGSLRAAVTAANANGADGAIISFDIGSSCGPHVIHLATELPDLKYEIHFEGYGQTGSSPNSLYIYNGNNAKICIILAGDNGVADGFGIASSVADSMTMSVQGIAFSGFTHAALNIRGGSGHLIAGIRTGGTVGGFAMDPNGYDVILAAGVHGVTIGGDPQNAYDSYNQFGGAVNNAIYIASASGATLAAHQNNINSNNIGFAVDANNNVTALPTGGAGVAVGGYKNYFFVDNIWYAGASGVHFSNSDSHDNNLNLVDIRYAADNGLLIDDDAHDNVVYGNDMYDNGGAGVRVVSGVNNSLQGNNISANGKLGIDLAGAGVTPDDNDSQVVDPNLANRAQNFPVLTSAKGSDYKGTVKGSLTSTPGKYQIDIYLTNPCDASGYGQGFNAPSYVNNTTPVVTIPGNITVQGQNTVDFTIPVTFSGSFGTNVSVTVTATDASGNTSEFSACVPYENDTIFADRFGD